MIYRLRMRNEERSLYSDFLSLLLSSYFVCHTEKGKVPFLVLAWIRNFKIVVFGQMAFTNIWYKCPHSSTDSLTCHWDTYPDSALNTQEITGVLSKRATTVSYRWYFRQTAQLCNSIYFMSWQRRKKSRMAGKMDERSTLMTVFFFNCYLYFVSWLLPKWKL